MPERPPNNAWASTGWWIGKALRGGAPAGTSISRTQLIDMWVRETPSPKPNVKHLAEDLAKWMGELGATTWIADLSSLEAARRMRQGINQLLDGTEIWDEVSGVAGTYGDPLARSSARVITDVKRERPAGLSSRISAVLRKYEDGTPRTAARNAMITLDECGLVLTSRSRADTFVNSPEQFEPAVVAAAMRAYSGKLTTYLDRTDDCLDDSTCDALAATIEHLTGLYGEPDAADRLPTAAEIALVHERLGKHLAKKSGAESYFDSPLIADATLYTVSDVAGEAWRRANRNLLRIVIDGVDLTDELVAQVYGSNYKRAIQDLRRRLLRERQLTAEPHPAERTGEPTAIGREDEGYRRSALIDLFRRAATHVRNCTVVLAGPWGERSNDTPPCWERRVVLELLGGYEDTATGQAFDLASNVEAGLLERVLRDRFASDCPSDALAPDGRRSVSLAVQLLRGALAMALHNDDVHGADGFDIAGQKNHGQSWSQKTAEVLHDLNRHRNTWNLLTEHTP